jgi:hypothetical protein
LNPISEKESANVVDSQEMDNVERIKERKEAAAITVNEIQGEETIHEISGNIVNEQDHNLDSPEENTGNKHPKSRSESVQRRLTIMFLVIIIAYVLSYIPPLVLLILTYAMEDFNFITLSEGQTIAWTYVPRFLFLNNIVNPFIYGYFDTKFRDQLQSCFKKWKAGLV